MSDRRENVCVASEANDAEPFTLDHDVPLAPRTTLELGGAARYFAIVRSEAEIVAALAWAERERVPALALGDGSNVIVSDAGFPGLVLDVRLRGIEVRAATDAHGAPCVHLTAAAGEVWDELVALTVERGWQGLECLSGIPGRVGATPIQNVGAYGQEVADTVVAVGVIDRKDRRPRTLGPTELAFGYRDSALKRAPERYVVTWVRFELRVGGRVQIRYAELARALTDRAQPSLDEVRRAVLSLRRAKSMVLDPRDPNRRSAGSFFMNPIVAPDVAENVVARAIASGIASAPDDVPRWMQPDGRVKLAAAWLIERAGFAKGTRIGNVGLSSAHALALVHHGGGTTAELLAFAERIRDRVRECFGIDLEREPVLVG